MATGILITPNAGYFFAHPENRTISHVFLFVTKSWFPLFFMFYRGIYRFSSKPYKKATFLCCKATLCKSKFLLWKHKAADDEIKQERQNNMKVKHLLPESGQNFHKTSLPPKLFCFSLDCSIFPDLASFASLANSVQNYYYY